MSASRNDPTWPDPLGQIHEATLDDAMWSQLVAQLPPDDPVRQHVERAHPVRRRLAEATAAQQLALELMDAANIGALAVRRDGEVALATERAGTLLQGASPLRLRAGRLVAMRAADQKQLLDLIAAALPHGRGVSGPPACGAMALARAGRMPLTVAVAPLPGARRLHLPSPLACVTVRDPDDAQLDANVLKGLFGFTPTEAVVAKHLAEGRSVAEIACWQDVSEATVRTQVARLLTKTHTARQGELICLLWRCALPVR